MTLTTNYKDLYMKFSGNLGIILLAIYLIVVGIVTIFGVAVPPIVIGILALVAGILLLIRG
jgi:hypothetical protein